MSAARASKGWSGLFATAFKRSHNAMALTTDDRRIVEVNAAAARLLGYRPSQLRGRYTYDLVMDGPLLSREQWRHAIDRGEVTAEIDLIHANGERVRAQFAAHPEVVTGQRLVLFVALATSRWGRHVRRETSEEGASAALSKREREVLSLVALGETSPEIAETLHISHNTVRKHVNSAMRKLGARSRAHLVAKALADGTITASSGRLGEAPPPVLVAATIESR
jgi:PAS domain S-box-containing protein